MNIPSLNVDNIDSMLASTSPGIWLPSPLKYSFVSTLLLARFASAESLRTSSSRARRSRYMMLHAPCSIMTLQSPSLDYTPQLRSGQCTPPAVGRGAGCRPDESVGTNAREQLRLWALGASVESVGTVRGEGLVALAVGAPTADRRRGRMRMRIDVLRGSRRQKPIHAPERIDCGGDEMAVVMMLAGFPPKP